MRGDGVGAKSYNGKKALSSISHSILSVYISPQYVAGIREGEGGFLQDNLYVDMDQIRKKWTWYGRGASGSTQFLLISIL